MKNFFRGIVFAIIALALGGWLYLRFGFADICADVPVSRFDSEIAGTALHASAERHMPKEKNPIQPTDANLFDGARCTETSVPIATADLTTPIVTMASLFIRRLLSS